MMPMCHGVNDEVKWKTSIDILITDCERLGNYMKNKKRVVRTTFLFMKHKMWLLSHKHLLSPGIYVEEAYPSVIQKRCMTFRPILRLAKSKTEYKGKCKFKNDVLIIKGTRYNTDSLNLLPEDLAP